MGDLKTFNIQNIKNEFNLKAFIETGTLYGDGVDYALNYFDIIHSIEIDKDLSKNAIKKYSSEPKVTIHEGHSPDVLNYLLPTLKFNILFWLDAHFPGADCHKAGYTDEKDMDKRLPLELELNAIKKHSLLYNDVIIIDDMWLYESGDFEWGNIDNHLKNINKLNITRKELVGKNSDFLYNLFNDSHNIKKNFTHQGYFIIEPKL